MMESHQGKASILRNLGLTDDTNPKCGETAGLGNAWQWQPFQARERERADREALERRGWEKSSRG